MTTRRSSLPSAPKLLSLAAAAGLVFAGAAVATPAVAAEQNVSDVTLAWGLNAETGAGAYNGSCNFLSAGTAGNTGSSRAWTEADGFHKPSEGNVKIVKNGPSNTEIPVSWANKCHTATGTPVSPSGISALSGNKIVLSKGTGKVDPATGTGTISWTGSFTSAFYGGLTYWSAKNPVLTVKADGTATLKATASGYGADQSDATVWNPIPAQTITLANLKGVTIDAGGFTIAPEYLGVAAPAGAKQSAPGSVNYGAFPTDFVAFQGATGTQPYWYSSGGGADPRKVASPMSVVWNLPVAPEPEPAGGSKDVNVDVKVPESKPVPKGFSWTVSGATTTLGTATQTEAGSFTAKSNLPTVTVSDTRDDSPGWTINGKASTFVDGANTFSGAALGWAPKATNATGGAVTRGGAVTAGDPGLGQSRTLASAATAAGAVLDADLTLLAPAGTPAGSYKSTLTITAISD